MAVRVKIACITVAAGMLVGASAVGAPPPDPGTLDEEYISRIASASASLSDVERDGWTVGAWAHVSRGATGGSEGVCAWASGTTFPARGRMVKITETGCTKQSLSGPYAKAGALFQLLPSRWAGHADGDLSTRVRRITYEWTPNGWRKLSDDHTRSTARVTLWWHAMDRRPGWWAQEASPSVQAPLCFVYAPPFVLPCLTVSAGAWRPAMVTGSITFEDAGTIKLGVGRPGRIRLYWTPVGQDCSGQC